MSRGIVKLPVRPANLSNDRVPARQKICDGMLELARVVDHNSSVYLPSSAVDVSVEGLTEYHPGFSEYVPGEAMRVLITGAAGTVGRQLTRTLEQTHDLRLGDIQPLDDPRWVSLDITEPQQSRAAVAGMDAVIHLAIAAGHEGEWEDDVFNRTRFDVNVRGTFNLLQAAAVAGVKRFVHTSSIMVVWGYPPPLQVAGDAEPRPVGTYAQTKMLAEVLCRQAVQDQRLQGEVSMRVICLRIAKPIDHQNETLKQKPVRPQWIPFADLVEAYRLALVADGADFEIVTLTGDSSRCRWDLATAARVLNYQSQIRLEDHGFLLGDEREAY